MFTAFPVQQEIPMFVRECYDHRTSGSIVPAFWIIKPAFPALGIECRFVGRNYEIISFSSLY